MDSKKLFAEIDRLYPEYIKVLADVCDIESPTAYKKGVDAVGRYFIDLAEKRGWDVEISHQEVAGDAISITMNKNVKAAPVCLSGHIDTVHPVGFFKEPRVRIDEECLRGPGALDCKGGVVASFMAMDALYNCGFNSRPVILIIQSDEETGSKTSDKKTIEFMCEKAKGALAFLNTEGMEPGSLVLERKGILRYEMVVHGIARHSSLCTDGANAVAEAAYKIIELEKMKEVQGLTCNCGVIHGGTVANSVADLCTFLIDIRFSTAEELERAQKTVEEVAAHVYIKGCHSEANFISSRPAMEKCELNYKLFERIREISREVGLPDVIARKATGGSDAAYTTIAGIPCIDNVGVAGGYLHSIDEYMVLRSLAESAKYQAAIAAYI